MRKVYVVVGEIEYEGGGAIEAFDTEEKANTRVEELEAIEHEYYTSFHIVDLEIK